MRYVDRRGVAPPASLTRSDGAGARELKRARGHYRDKSAGSFAFAAYKGADVAEAMRSLFAGKCAYCESFHSASSPTDVEHYRPKAGVEGDAAHRGYWWLAADWSNLLPSCALCNRRNGLRIAQPGMGRAEVSALAPVTVGKGNLFPIRGRRASGPRGDCEAEDPLLIDPTRRDPARHLEWPQDKLSLLAPRFDGREPDPYGRATIDVLGLNRQDLVEERSRYLGIARVLLANAEFALTAASVLSGAGLQQSLLRFDENLASLKGMCAPDQPYSAMLDAHLNQRLQDLLAQYRALRAQRRASASEASAGERELAEDAVDA
ncbi:hypothetical protein K4L06_13580 [Lysobacter sp. BMK333-48F3]|uniref:hypothetical protein n=1 Tax=Lysobacter sp. BMK333-48F3 TaxID=2867962 RepID=UPI001C8B69F0|nr:hypothetical protein [Lysobacter sp. BMK333-48F3]MBX9402340.1 hypothetical protein [Lysobacter sp. BMK333-48F3]